MEILGFLLYVIQIWYFIPLRIFTNDQFPGVAENNYFK